MKTSIAIADDHRLLAQALSDLIQKFDDYEVLFVAENGRDLIRYLNRGEKPDIVLLDVSMPEMDGFETAAYLKQHHPGIKVMVLSMMDREEHIVRMVRQGAKGYLLKGCRPSELRQALDDLRTKGYHYSDFFTDKLIRSLNPDGGSNPAAFFNFSDREFEFLKKACSELTYNEIADRMCVSSRTVDGYRESVFQKMNVKTRVGMVMEAIRWGLIDP
ncbi:response regulator transcription factor [Larkinella soli]|uniref:response regulator transcription factor n=1 Tax=Larkinella soli TaxID=1770527 RepID=UPI000FFC8427|nr:response regulator transcription factor [Larkinella soli]